MVSPPCFVASYIPFFFFFIHQMIYFTLLKAYRLMKTLLEGRIGNKQKLRRNK